MTDVMQSRLAFLAPTTRPAQPGRLRLSIFTRTIRDEREAQITSNRTPYPGANRIDQNRQRLASYHRRLDEEQLLPHWHSRASHYCQIRRTTAQLSIPSDKIAKRHTFLPPTMRVPPPLSVAALTTTLPLARTALLVRLERRASPRRELALDSSAGAIKPSATASTTEGPILLLRLSLNPSSLRGREGGTRLNCRGGGRTVVS